MVVCVLGVTPGVAAAGIPLGTSVRVEYADPGFADPAYAASDGAPQVRDYQRSSGYHRVVRDSFASVTPENELQFWSIWPTADGPPNFAPADRIVEWARKIDKQIRGHALVFDDSLPNWMREGHHSSLELRAIMRRHIRTTMSRYRGVIKEWDVLNEPMLASGGFRPPALPGLDGTSRDPSVWKRAGSSRLPRAARRKLPAYIYEAFRVARRTDPDAKLCVNEVAAEGINAKSNALYLMVAVLKSLKLIDCVGFQAHFTRDYTPPAQDDIERNLARFAALGVEVQFTEMDVPINLVAPKDGLDLGHHEAERRWQHGIYDRIASACSNQPKCTKLTVWGASDDNTWRGAGTEPLLFTKDMQPKPALTTVTSRLSR